MDAKDQGVAIVVMGVCGVGKSTVALALSDRLGARFIEADDYHTSENRKAMSQGIPLTDEMRRPWLLALGAAAETARQTGHVVLACSALKYAYRDLLRSAITRTKFVYLHGSRDLIADRISLRKDHYMPVSLLDSQIATLEPPTPEEGAIFVEVAGEKNAVYDRAEALVQKYANSQ